MSDVPDIIPPDERVPLSDVVARLTDMGGLASGPPGSPRLGDAPALPRRPSQ
jgi:hypothetical protein